MSTTDSTTIADADIKTLTGGCPCANLRYEISVSTKDGYPSQSLCHCFFCKKMSGSSFTRNLLIPASSMRLLSGEPKLYKHNKPMSTAPHKHHDPESSNNNNNTQTDTSTTESSDKLARWSFCPQCGGLIYNESDALPGLVIIKVGTLDRSDLISQVGSQIFCRSRDGWVVGEGKGEEDGCFETLPAYLLASQEEGGAE